MVPRCCCSEKFSEGKLYEASEDCSRSQLPTHEPCGAQDAVLDAQAGEVVVHLAHADTAARDRARGEQDEAADAEEEEWGDEDAEGETDDE